MFKTVADPSSIRSKRTERNVVTRIATTGMDVLELTLVESQLFIFGLLALFFWINLPY